MGWVSDSLYPQRPGSTVASERLKRGMEYKPCVSTVVLVTLRAVTSLGKCRTCCLLAMIIVFIIVIHDHDHDDEDEDEDEDDDDDDDDVN